MRDHAGSFFVPWFCKYKFLGAVFNGSYPVSAWKWIDGNNDGIAESYYFDQSGYVLMNRERYFKVVFIKK